MSTSLPAIAQKIELWPIERLKPYARNARTHSDAQVQQIAASIQKFGFVNPILVDSADGIIAGHGRYQAALKLKLTHVPVIVLDHLSDAERRAYIIADNKLAENAGWDSALLAIELQELSAALDIELTGFDTGEFEAMLKKMQAPDEFPEYDESIETEHRCPKCGYEWSGPAI